MAQKFKTICVPEFVFPLSYPINYLTTPQIHHIWVRLIL